MICTRNLAFSLLTLSAAAIAAIFVSKRTHRDLPDANYKRKPPLSLRNIIKKRKPSSPTSILFVYFWELENTYFYLICCYAVFYIASAGNKDTISELPDDILISILSRVPLKCAIRTSLLSKRWRNLYRHVSRIQLACRDFLGPLSSRYLDAHDTNLLVDSLNNFFRLHTGSRVLVLELSCCFQQFSTDRISSCFRSFGRLGIEKFALNGGCYLRGLTLNFYPDLLTELRCLKYFKLSNCNLCPSLSSIQCNSLQILWLNGVTIHPGAVECILSSCSRLRSLRIIDCRCPPKLCLCGPNLQLKALLVSYCEGVKDIELYAANLVLFEFRSLEEANFIFDHVPKLNHMYYHINNYALMPYVGGNFLEDLPHLKSLNFDARGYDFQEAVGSVRFINIFSNLSRLNLSVYLCPGVNLLFMAPLLQSCPLLEEFQLNKRFLKSDGPNGRQEKGQPIAFHAQLKKMEISGFDGTEDELEFALYILKSAISLETMHIIRCCKRYLGYAAWSNVVQNPWSEEIHGMIQTTLRGQAISETAQVIVRHEVHVDSDSHRRAQDDYIVGL